MKITNTLKDIKIQKIPSCPLVNLALRTINGSFQMFGGAYTSSDLNESIMVGNQTNGQKYDPWSHNFKKEIK